MARSVNMAIIITVIVYTHWDNNIDRNDTITLILSQRLPLLLILRLLVRTCVRITIRARLIVRPLFLRTIRTLPTSSHNPLVLHLIIRLRYMNHNLSHTV